MAAKHSIGNDGYIYKDGVKTSQKASQAQVDAYNQATGKSITLPKGAPVKSKPKSGYDYKNDPEFQEAMGRYANTDPNKVVTPEQYAELKRLYDRAKASGKGQTKETLEFQKAYHAILPDEALRVLATDEKGRRTNKGSKSGKPGLYLEDNEDSYFGSRTERYMEALEEKVKTQPKVNITPPSENDHIDEAFDDMKNAPTDTVATHLYDKKAFQKPVGAPWWLQDKLNIAHAAGNLARVKKFPPWVATANVNLPRATFYDPERALASNTEMMNLGTQGLANFGNPQAYTAGFSAIQGMGAKNAADILGKYENMNVGVSNQQEAQNASIMNQYNQNKAQQQTDLFDKYTIMNQQFKNDKDKYRNNLFSAFQQGLTNRANTYNLNQINPQYSVNPSDGGMVYGSNFRDIKPEKPSTTASARFSKLLEDNPHLRTDAGMKIAWDMVKQESGIKSPSASYDDFEKYAQSQSGT